MADMSPGGVTNPAALAAAIGRKKLGAKKMAKFSAEGRKRAADHREAGRKKLYQK